MTLIAYDMTNTLQDFLAENGLSTANISFLAGDASPRKYYRVFQEGQTFVLMETPSTEKPDQFIKIATVLAEHGFSAPKILAYNLQAGYILLEDLKDETFTAVLKKSPDQAGKLYTLATQAIIKLSQTFIQKPDCVEEYSEQQFMDGVRLFAEWYYPATHGHQLDASALAEFEVLWSRVFAAIDTLPKSLMLRDFHVDNLMYLEDRSGIKACGLLDFQDARWGPIAYDFISLIDDVRVHLDPRVEEMFWKLYAEAFPDFQFGKRERILAHMLSVSRLVRILGTFVRLAKRDGKVHYLNHIPRIWQLIDKNFALPELAEIKDWFDRHVSVRIVTV